MELMAATKSKGNDVFPLQRKRSAPLFFQPKLVVGPVDDGYEREADAVADQVMRMGSDHEQVQSKISPVIIQRTCAACEEEEQVQRKEDGESYQQTEAPSIEAGDPGDKPMDSTAGSFSKNHLEYNFSKAKVQAGSPTTVQRQCPKDEQQPLQHKHDSKENLVTLQPAQVLRKTTGNEIVQMQRGRTRMSRVRHPKLSLYQADATTDFFRQLAVSKASDIGAVSVDSTTDCPEFASFGAVPYYSGADIIEIFAKVFLCTGHQIEEVHIFSHGNSHVVDASEGTTGRSLYDDPVYAVTAQGGRSVGDIQPEVFSPGAAIVLHGCQTASGDDNIAERFLRHLLGTSPRARVYGHSQSGTCGRTRDWREYSGRFPDGRSIRNNPFHPAPVQPKAMSGVGISQRKGVSCEEEHAQRKESVESHEPSEAPSIVSDALGAGGNPLDGNTRSFMESRFGYDFSGVRIHTGSLAETSAESIHALAYTSGNNIVFNEGQYKPETKTGKQLLAHELTHTLQQGGSVQAKTVQRTNIHPPRRTDCDALDDFIRLIVVNQESPQTVTVFWNYSGNTETATCSTGKGTCCIDSGAGDDIVGAQQAASMTGGSHWTPIGVKAVAIITNLGPDDQRRYWTEFDDPRDIALHAYNTFDGTPLSHGCVRMGVDMARTIYCGSIVGRTRVEVRGFARPRCSNATLQAEWTADGITPIPRCASHSGLDVEVERLQRVSLSQTNQTIINTFRINLGRATSVAEATAAAQTAGADLWSTSHGTISGSTVTVDDRPLYWTRNFITRELQEWNPIFTVSRANRASILNAFEMASRGLSVTTFRTVASGVRRILITGFDPFGMDGTSGRVGASRGMSVGNPSGAIVLALDGQTITGTNCSAMVQGAIMPVRYADFDRGVVEDYVRNFISGGNAVDMIMTISRNRDDGIFELERFAGRTRAAHTDNAGQRGSQADLNRSLSRIHPGSTRADEFTESGLLGRGMESGTTVVPDASYTGHLPDGTPVSETTSATPPPTAISDTGSGGDFLSNEIFYRVSMLQLNQHTQIPMGHLHVPAGTQSEYQGIVNTVRQMITRALNSSLCPAPASTSTSTSPS